MRVVAVRFGIGDPVMPGGRAVRMAVSVAWSTWRVACVIPYSPDRNASRSARTAWQSAPGATSTCAEAAGRPEVISQICRSWTSHDQRPGRHRRADGGG